MRNNFLITTVLLSIFLFASCTTGTDVNRITEDEETLVDRIDALFITTATNDYNLNEDEIDLLVREMNTELPIDQQLVVLEKFAKLNQNDLDSFNEKAILYNIDRAKDMDMELYSNLEELSYISIRRYASMNEVSIKLYEKPLHRITTDQFVTVKALVEQIPEYQSRSSCLNDGGGSDWFPGLGANGVFGYDQHFIETPIASPCDIRVDYGYSVRQRVEGATPMGSYVIRSNGNGLLGRTSSNAVHVYVGYWNGWSHCSPMHDIKLAQ